jgi:branched-chain amino acid transport system ATP-binding protein
VSLLRVESLAVAFGGVQALRGVSFTVEPGEVFSIIGPNGAGKTTLFNIVSGVYRADAGRVLVADADVTGLPPHALAARGLSRTFQNLQVFPRMTAAENVMVGRHLRESRNVLAHLLGLPSVLAETHTSRARADDLLDLVHLGDYAEVEAGAMPYGALKRLEIARALAAEPRLVLLDEPAAGCNAVETEEIEKVIASIAARGVTIVLVEHDMKLVMRISRRIHVLNHGETLAEGAPDAIRTDPKVIEAYLGLHSAEAGA